MISCLILQRSITVPRGSLKFSTQSYHPSSVFSLFSNSRLICRHQRFQWGRIQNSEFKLQTIKNGELRVIMTIIYFNKTTLVSSYIKSTGEVCFWDSRLTLSQLPGGTERSVRHSAFISETLPLHPSSVSHSSLVWQNSVAKGTAHQEVSALIIPRQPWTRRTVLLAATGTPSSVPASKSRARQKPDLNLHQHLVSFTLSHFFFYGVVVLCSFLLHRHMSE